jgi:hypothetical protein
MDGNNSNLTSETNDPANVISFGGSLENSMDRDQIDNIKRFIRQTREYNSVVDTKNEFLDLIDSNANAYSQFNTITKIKYFYLKHEWACITVRELLAIGIIILSFLLYYWSLKVETNYQNYNVYLLYPMTLSSLIKCVSAGLIIGFIIFCMYVQWIFLEHFIYILIVYIILVTKHFGSNILNHGKYNFYIFVIGSSSLFLILLSIHMIYRFSKTIKYLYLIIAFFALFVLFLICYNIKDKYHQIYICENWDLTINDTYISDKYDNCPVPKPEGFCYMNQLYKYFDLTLANNIKCSTRNEVEYSQFYDMIPNKISHDSTTINSINSTYSTNSTDSTNSTSSTNSTVSTNSTDSTKSTDSTNSTNWTMFGLPPTNVPSFNQSEQSMKEYIFDNLINLENEVLSSEATINFSNETKLGELNLTCIKNDTLAEERKKIEKNKNEPLEKNIFVIFLSSTSRAHFQRAMPKLTKFIKKFMEYQPFPTITAYQFSKYYNCPFRAENVESLFYPKLENNSHINILKLLKDNGYITGQVGDKCEKFVSDDINDLYVQFDHENIGFSCLSNYTNNQLPPYERCLYGKPISEYMINYALDFWEKYSDNKKYFRMIFNYGDEPTGNLLTYLDEPLYNMLNNLYNNGKLKDTAVFILSEQGNRNNGLYNLMKSAEFEIEKKYGLFIILVGYNEKFKNGTFHQNLLSNQNIISTPYDVFHTLHHFSFGNFNDTTLNGKSLLSNIEIEQISCPK